MSVATAVKREIKLKKAPKYCNVFYNNQRTPVDVVIHLLIAAFKLSPEKAVGITKEIHENTKGIVFINSKEVCEHKEEMVSNELSRIGEKHLKHTVELYEDEEDE